MVLQGLHRVWPPIIALCQQLAAELGHPVQANAYVTPPQNQGFSNHYDVHDVFVLQIEGEKRWQIHAPVLEAPLRDQPWNDRRAAVERRAQEPPLIEAVLRPGDCLYLPRGFLHAATALGGVSTHLTIGVHSWTRYALAEQLLSQALRTVAQDPRRAQLAAARAWTSPSRPRCAADIDLARSALVEAAAAGRRRSGRPHPATQRRAAPSGLRRSVRCGSCATLERSTPDTVLRLRGHLAAHARPSRAAHRACAAARATSRSTRTRSPR